MPLRQQQQGMRPRTEASLPYPSRHLSRVRFDLVVALLAPHDLPHAGSGHLAESHARPGVGFHRLVSVDHAKDGGQRW